MNTLNYEIEKQNKKESAKRISTYAEKAKKNKKIS